MPRDAWQTQAAATMSAIARWREAQPRASWADLKAARDAELGTARARVLVDSVQASPAAAPRPEERPRRPECGTVLHDA